MIGNLASLPQAPAATAVAALLVLAVLAACAVPRPLRTASRFYTAGMAGIAVAFALEAAALAARGGGTARLFLGGLRADALSSLFTLLVLAAAFVFLATSLASRETTRRFEEAPEYLALALAATLGMIGLAGAANVLVLVLALELLSFSSYLLTGIVDRDDRSTEAALKYLLYGGTASAVLVYGFSLLYGMTGTLDLAAMGAALAGGGHGSLMVFLALAFVLAGAGYKIAAVPFHAWCPDVYEGAATPFAAFLSVGSKIAGFALLVRVLFLAFSSADAAGAIQPAAVDWTPLLALLAAATMTVGNLAALPQRNIKRMLAWSSIAHAGYVLMALAARSRFGLSAAFLYLAVYLLMNLGAFLVVTLVQGEYATDRVEGYRGLAWRGPRGAFLAVMLTLCLFSLTGLPPFAGFVGKLYVVRAALERAAVLWWLAALAVLNTVVSLYYYARVVSVMFFARRPAVGPERGATAGERAAYALLGGLAGATLVLGIFWAPLDRLGRLLPGFLP